MKRVAMIIAIVVLTAAVAALAQEAGKKATSCRYCGMALDTFAHSRVSLAYDDGTTTEVCSLHCAAVDLSMHADLIPKAILAADYNTKNMIDARKAMWVVGGRKPGVMSRRAKWAFEKTEDADKYVKENGGMAVPFDATLKYTFADMYPDLKLAREKSEERQKKMMQMRKRMQESTPRSKWSGTKPEK